jgi:cytochrome c biogenesis factor
MDVNEHDNLSSCKLGHKLKWRTALLLLFYISVFSNEHNSYPKMSVKWPLVYSWTVVLTCACFILYFIFVVVGTWEMEVWEGLPG